MELFRSDATKRFTVKYKARQTLQTNKTEVTISQLKSKSKLVSEDLTDEEKSRGFPVS